MANEVRFEELDEIVARLKGTVKDALRSGTSIDQVEQDLLKQLMSLGHSLLGALFRAAGDCDVGPTLNCNGKTLNRLPERSKRDYRSVFGRFELERAVYGTRSGQTFQAIPFDEHFGLPKNSYSLLIESWIGLLATDASFHESCEKLERIFGLSIPVDSAERIASRLGKSAASILEIQPEIDIEIEAEILVQTSDNKGIVILDNQTPVGRLPVGSPSETKGPKPNQKRMACVAGIYTIKRNTRTPEQVLDMLFHTKESPSPETKPPKPVNPRYFARLSSVDATGSQVGPSAEEQAQRWMTANAIRRFRPVQVMVVMHDGQPSLWEQNKVYQEGWKTIDIIDLLHVIPRIWTAAKILAPEAQTSFVKERLLLILMGGIKTVLMGFRRMNSTRVLTSEQRNEMTKVINYLENNKERMDYHRYLSEGLPIATGFIEGACRHVVKDRLERSGMRWTRDGAQAMLNLRCIDSSELWDMMLAEHRNVALQHYGKRTNYHDQLLHTAA